MWQLQFLKTNPQSVSNMHTETIRSKTESNSRHMDYKHIYICQSIHCFTGEGNRQYQEIPLLSHTSKYGHIKSFGQAASTYYGYSYYNIYIYNYIWFDYNIYIHIYMNIRCHTFFGNMPICSLMFLVSTLSRQQPAPFFLRWRWGLCVENGGQGVWWKTCTLMS